MKCRLSDQYEKMPNKCLNAQRLTECDCDSKPAVQFDLVGSIMDFESGQLGNQKTVELFSHLVKTGMAWTLQGSYGRMARHMIDNLGVISESGEINQDVVDELIAAAEDRN